MLLPPDVASAVGATTPEMLFLDAEPGADLAAVRGGVTDAVAPYVVASVLDADEFAGEVASQVESILAIVYALLGLSVLVAVLGIVNTLALSVVERTREIGLLRAVGLGRAQLATTIVIESVLVAVFGTAVGLVVGTGLAAALPSVLADEGFTTLAVPWAQLGAMLALAAVVGVVAAVWPAARAARLPVLDAVSQE
jgi:putative ABC transport system permease protein